VQQLAPKRAASAVLDSPGPAVLESQIPGGVDRQLLRQSRSLAVTALAGQAQPIAKRLPAFGIQRPSLAPTATELPRFCSPKLARVYAPVSENDPGRARAARRRRTGCFLLKVPRRPHPQGHAPLSRQLRKASDKHGLGTACRSGRRREESELEANPESTNPERNRAMVCSRKRQPGSQPARAQQLSAGMCRNHVQKHIQDMDLRQCFRPRGRAGEIGTALASYLSRRCW